MIKDDTTKFLFCRMPRDVGFPQRVVVNSIKDLEYQVQKNKDQNIYVSIYPTNLIIDKIFLDFDYGNPLEEAQRVASYWELSGNSYIPVASGRDDRIHLYLLLKPKIYGPEAKLLLLKATYNILTAVYGPICDSYAVIDGRNKRVFLADGKIISPDPAVVGDIRRISRLPNSRRAFGTYCTYLPPDKFLTMTKSELLQHIKTPHTYTYETRHLPLLTDFNFEFDSIPQPKTPISENSSSPQLKELLRPCLYRHITNQHPTNDIRVICTIDLLYLGFSPEKICELYSTLGWEDFNPIVTLEKIQYAKKKQYTPYACSTLRRMNIPNACCIS